MAIEQQDPTDDDDIQAVVDRLAAQLGQSVLIEDRAQHPVWWSTRGAVDRTRLRTVLDRHVDPPAARVVRQFKLAQATAPVRTPAIPEAEMWARWCMPVRFDGELYGLVWVLDPDGTVAASELGALVDCAERAAPVMARAQLSKRDAQQRRGQLIEMLLAGRDEEAARDLAELEHLGANARVQVDASGSRGGWLLPNGLRAHAAAARSRAAISGAPVPLVDLSEAVGRAVATRRAVLAGARLDPVSWDALGAWRLVVDAPATLDPAAVHPGAAILASLPRDDLLTTARTVLDLGGDVTSAATALHVHRTTLYYRLDRILELTGVDLRAGGARTDLQLALWLAAYRQTPA